MSGICLPFSRSGGTGRERRHRPSGKLGEGPLWLRVPVSPGQRAHASTSRYPTTIPAFTGHNGPGARTPRVRPSGPEFQPVRKRKAQPQAGQTNRNAAFAWLRRPVKARMRGLDMPHPGVRTSVALAWPFNLDFPLRPEL